MISIPWVASSGAWSWHDLVHLSLIYGIDKYSFHQMAPLVLMDTLGVRGLQSLMAPLVLMDSVSNGHSECGRVTVSLVGVGGLQCLWWTLWAWESYSVSDKWLPWYWWTLWAWEGYSLWWLPWYWWTLWAWEGYSVSNQWLPWYWWTLWAWEGYSVSNQWLPWYWWTVSLINGAPGTDGHSGWERVTVSLMDTLGVRGLQCL